MSDAFQEVEEELRQERLTVLWQRYGNFILSIVVGSVILTALISAYKHWDLKQREAGTASLLAAVNSPDFPDGFDESGFDARGDIRALAFMNAAGAALDKGDFGAAIEFYGRVIDMSPEKAGDVRDLAIVMTARLDIGKVEGLLPVIAEDKDRLYSAQAALDLAAYEGGVKGDYKAAVDRLLELKERGSIVPSIVSQADALLHVYGQLCGNC